MMIMVPVLAMRFLVTISEVKGEISTRLTQTDVSGNNLESLVGSLAKGERMKGLFEGL